VLSPNCCQSSLLSESACTANAGTNKETNSTRLKPVEPKRVDFKIDFEVVFEIDSEIDVGVDKNEVMFSILMVFNSMRISVQAA